MRYSIESEVKRYLFNFEAESESGFFLVKFYNQTVIFTEIIGYLATLNSRDKTT